MSATICYRCDDGLSLSGFVPEKFKDSDGNKPCAECLAELIVDEEEEEIDGY